jgi:proline dehydrogenase
MLRALLLYLSEHKTPQRLLMSLPAARRLPRRFIAGETLEDALAAIRRLNAEGFEVTLDHLGESVAKPADAEAACGDYLQVMGRLRREGLCANVSIKLTALGLALDETLAGRHIAALVERACQLRAFVRIDMEGSAFTESTLRIFRRADAPHERLGIVIQSYLRRSEHDVDVLLESGARIRLVKGAYKEPPEIAFPAKADVDANFVKLMQKMLGSCVYHAIATHDSAIIAATLDFARGRNIGVDQFEFQMLYGVRRRLQRSLLQQGYRVRIYVPYGKQWYPYFMRRLAERPANVLFLLRSLVRD